MGVPEQEVEGGEPLARARAREMAAASLGVWRREEAEKDQRRRKYGNPFSVDTGTDSSALRKSKKQLRGTTSSASSTSGKVIRTASPLTRRDMIRPGRVTTRPVNGDTWIGTPDRQDSTRHDHVGGKEIRVATAAFLFLPPPRIHCCRRKVKSPNG